CSHYLLSFLTHPPPPAIYTLSLHDALPIYELARSLLTLNQGHLVFGPGLGEEVVHARLARDRRRRQGVVARDHHGLDAHLPELFEALAHPAFDDVLQVNHAERALAVGDDERRAARPGDALDDLAQLLRRGMDADGQSRARA